MENTENKVLKTVAIIGRPNVGKSTLFNRLVGRRVAIETPIPGTTRDRLHAEVEWQGETLELIDVAGIETGSKKEIDASIQAGVELAIEAADLVLFVVDWNEKNNDSDKRIARRLLPIKNKVLLVVNKADNIDRIKDISEFRRLGPFPITSVSAISGKSSGDLLDEVVERLKNVVAAKSAKKHFDIRLSIIGRPNVGKSTLLNSIVGQKRAVVSEEPGTTRDIIDVQFSHKGKSILIADTAGIRRPGKVLKDTIESFSVIRSYRALKNADVAILVIDALEELTALDANILGKAKEWGKGIVLAVNKIDLIEDKDHFMARELKRLQFQLNFAPWLPVVFISAADKTNINFLLNQVLIADANRRMKIPPEKLAEILAEAKDANPQLISVFSLEQTKTAPPIFVARYKGREKPHYTQIRYLENRLRDAVPLNGTPLFIDLKKK